MTTPSTSTRIAAAIASLVAMAAVVACSLPATDETSSVAESDLSAARRCVPTTCAKAGYTCGTLSTCGSSLNCGSCAAGSSCSNHECVAACVPRTCASVGWTCGALSDGCGGTLNCGVCPAGDTCNGGTCEASAPPTCPPAPPLPPGGWAVACQSSGQLCYEATGYVGYCDDCLQCVVQQ
jgi:hypothetical protein